MDKKASIADEKTAYADSEVGCSGQEFGLKRRLHSPDSRNRAGEDVVLLE